MRACPVLAIALTAAGACGGASPGGPSAPGSGVPTATVIQDPVTVAGAGDIGWCGVPQPEATAKLLDAIPGEVLTLGDNAYPDASAADFRNCYEPNWGRHKYRTHPSLGNHERNTPGAAAYFDYFGENAGPARLGYYSFDLGSWHLIALDSTQAMGEGSAQLAWLKTDLASTSTSCTLAYWHSPLFTSGPSPGFQESRDAWLALHKASADLVICAHDHLYERFAPQDPYGRLDLSVGIREFIVGTGGAPLYNATRSAANSEARGKAHGVLRLTLKAGEYEWEFVPIAGATFRDFGTGKCH